MIVAMTDGEVVTRFNGETATTDQAALRLIDIYKKRCQFAGAHYKSGHWAIFVRMHDRGIGRLDIVEVA